MPSKEPSATTRASENSQEPPITDATVTPQPQAAPGVSATVHRLNHAVLFVRDAEVTGGFYCDQLGFSVVYRMRGRAVFLRARGSTNDHDLGLFTVGDSAAPRAPQAIGLYHLAWQVDTVDQLALMQQRLSAVGCLVGMSDHGVSRSLYAQDPDGNEFEVMWAVPREHWPAKPGVAPLDLTADLVRHSGVSTLNQLSVTAG